VGAGGVHELSVEEVDGLRGRPVSGVDAGERDHAASWLRWRIEVGIDRDGRDVQSARRRVLRNFSPRDVEVRRVDRLSGEVAELSNTQCAAVTMWRLAAVRATEPPQNCPDAWSDGRCV
jgi:hypothetical protein